jgi:Tol biopolymer transport system component
MDRETIHPWRGARYRLLGMVISWAVCASGAAGERSEPSEELRADLKDYSYRVVYETYREGNWELFLMKADGSDAVNLTQTPAIDEMYPKASPDGTKICFVADEGKGKDKARSVYVMNADGTGRTVVCHRARWPCWRFDGKVIAYLKCQPGPYTTNHAATKGLFYYDLVTGRHAPHVNADIAKLLCISWSPDHRWFVATASGGLGYGFSIIAFEAAGKAHCQLLASKKGAWQCRPDFGPKGKQIAYAAAVGEGPPDKIFLIETADVDLTGSTPRLGNRRHVVTAPWPTELYHADWSPDGKYLLFSRGPREKNRMKPQRAIIGIHAPGWNICVAEAGATSKWVALTTDGLSNKEPDWVVVK